MKVACVKCRAHGSLTTKMTVSHGLIYRYYHVEHSNKGKKSWCYIGKKIPEECTQTRYRNDTQKDTHTRTPEVACLNERSLGRASIPRLTVYETVALPG